MRVAFWSVAVLFACGAETPSVTPISGPEGQSGWLQVNCPRNPHKCHELASEYCPGGYDVQEFRIGGASRYDSPGAMDEPIGPPGKNGQMLIACRGAAGPAPAH
jgi:hypothetical protein